MKTLKPLIILRKSIFGLLILCSVQLQAIEHDEKTYNILAKEDDWKPSTSIYFELAGKFLPSVNVDFRMRENLAISFGTGLWYDNEEHEQFIFAPSVNAYYLFGKKKRIEIGGGTGPFITTYLGFASLLIFGNIGYRYQKRRDCFFVPDLLPLLVCL